MSFAEAARASPYTAAERRREEVALNASVVDRRRLIRPPSPRSGGCWRGGRRTINAVSPHQFSPFGNPFSGSPLSKRYTPKGEHRRGHQRGGSMAQTAAWSLFFSMPFNARRRACRLRTAALRVAATTPPLAVPPTPRPGGQGQPATGSARSGLRHGVGLPRCGGCQTVLRFQVFAESRLHNAPTMLAVACR